MLIFNDYDPVTIGCQIVQAETRGDRCYENKKGWYWHRFDADWAIDTATITGPFASYDEAFRDMDTAKDAA